MRAAVLFLCCSLLALETSATPAAPIENRYLFILDTSLGMKRVSKAAHEAVLELITSGMQGNMRPGDTFGIWTFNHELSTGPFPMQQWALQQQAAVVTQAAEFLDQLGYENQSRWENVLPALQQVMEASRWLTVILVTDGRTAMVGTPFDAEINSLYRRHYRDLRDARLPFFILLTSQDGKLEDFSVNSSLGPMRFPTPPPQPDPEPLVAKIDAPPPPGIPDASPVPAPPQTSAGRSAPPAKAQAESPATNGIVKAASPRLVKSTSPALAPAITTRTSAPPAAPDLGNSKPERTSVSVPPPSPARGVPEAPGTAVPPPIATAPAEAAPVQVQNVAPPEVNPPEAHAPPTPPPIESPPAPLPVQPGTGAIVKPPPEQTRPAEASSPEPAEQSLAMTVPPDSRQMQRIVAAAIAFLFCAAGVLLLWIRKARKPSQPSLISRSMNR